MGETSTWYWVSRYGGEPKPREVTRETAAMIFYLTSRGERRELKVQTYGRWYSDREKALEAVAEHKAHEDRQAANMRIRNAAPELLSAAIDLRASLDPEELTPEQFNAWHALDAAISKATGQ